MRLVWLPHPEVRLQVEYRTRHFGETDPEEVIVTLPDDEAVLPVALVSVGATDHLDGTFTKPLSAYVRPFSIGDGPLSEVRFGIVNRPRFVWTEAAPEGVGQGELRLDSRDWEVSIRPSGGYELESKLRETGGFAITHQATLRNKKGAFSVAEGMDHLRCLHCFLAFARGAWCPPVLPVGLDEEGRVVWEDWAVWVMDDARWHQTWLDSSYPQGMHLLYPEFVKLWSGPWRRTLQRLTHMYVEANARTSVDTGVVVSVAALQLLAWSASLRKEPGFPAANPSDKISYLVEWMSLPSEIPAEASALNAHALKRFPRDPERRKAPHMVEQIRHDIVHPARDPAPPNAELDARSLGLQWLELGMLRLMNYSGRYVNRLKRQHTFGEHLPVPWAS